MKQGEKKEEGVTREEGCELWDVTEEGLGRRDEDG